MFADYLNAVRTLSRALRPIQRHAFHAHVSGPAWKQASKAKQLRIQRGRTRHNRKATR